ncbi:hydroxymethylglutaryl-CoA lyase [Paraburkholderia strydomiana]|uniref:hydroxymethylglutaryl-CoA lyase n=1 Tax=Paraburkholderia strydomiana TaxID=1245417 RepID=UPI0038BA8958
MRNASGKRLYIQEVSVRDGLQIEPRFVPTLQKIDLINGLSRTGLAKIEVTSFTSPKAIPALADAEDVMRGIERVEGVEYAALVPNERGAERALACAVDELNFVISASETHNLANLRMSCTQSLAQLVNIAKIARGRAHINVSLSTAFGCPFEGEISDDTILGLIDRITNMGLGRVTLCDTTGMANPAQVQRVCNAVKTRWPGLVVTAHFHDTRGMGLANALAALEAGVDRFDASLGGLGGCPFAPGASGNVCTEDLVHMFMNMGYTTCIDLDALLVLANRIPRLVGHDVSGQLIKAGPSSRLYPVPDGIRSSEPQQRLAGCSASVADSSSSMGGTLS